jgi:hypothetical protein
LFPSFLPPSVIYFIGLSEGREVAFVLRKMASSIDYSSFDLETHLHNAGSPTSFDDIFVDINWPEDHIEREIEHESSAEDDDLSSNTGFCGCDQCQLSLDVIDIPKVSPLTSCPASASDFVKDGPEALASTDGSPQPSTPYLSTPQSSTSQSSNATPQTSASSAPAESQTTHRFPKEVRSILRMWFNEHKENPYPTSEEKNELAEKTGLKRNQISLWLANTRRRHRTHQPIAKDAMSVPEVPVAELNPMDRWKILPFEREYPALPTIRAAVATFSPPAQEGNAQDVRQDPSVIEYEFDRSSSKISQKDSSYGAFWAQSTTSYESGLTNLISGSSLSGGTFSYLPSVSSSTSKTGPRDRRRRRNQLKLPLKASNKQKPFQCTFCPDSTCTFSTKYDWQRHEKSQHLSLEKWTCCLSGGIVETKFGPACAFCGEINPSAKHLEKHNFSACQEKPITEKTFYRKDHFQQHLRLMHESKYNNRMQVWQTEVKDIKSRCGFCNATFSTWAARADHLAAHFKCHAKMSDWVGDWGFEPQIAALIECSTRVPTHSMVLPPSQIAFDLPQLDPGLGMGQVGVPDYQQMPGLPFDSGPLDAGALRYGFDNMNGNAKVGFDTGTLMLDDPAGLIDWNMDLADWP